jgi:hypothetical protein
MVPAERSRLSSCQLNADQQLRDGDRSNGDVILISDQVIEAVAASF